MTSEPNTNRIVCQGLSINKDGEFCHEGVEITHPGTVSMLFKNFDRDESGTYFVQVGCEWAAVEVEAAPYVVKAVREQPDGLVLILSDGSQEMLGSDGLWISGENVLHCRVRNGKFPARFSRPAYYQIADHIEQSKGGAFVIRFAGQTLVIRPCE